MYRALGATLATLEVWMGTCIAAILAIIQSDI